MENREHIIILYDYYGELFSLVQRKYFEAYYFDNLSLSEISENENKSRNAIHKSIKAVVKKLYEYEEKLKLYEKDKKIKKIILDVDDKNIKKRLEELLWMRDYQLKLKI